jgi:hypothetical protein
VYCYTIIIPYYICSSYCGRRRRRRLVVDVVVDAAIFVRRPFLFDRTNLNFINMCGFTLQEWRSLSTRRFDDERCRTRYV